jgi:hypothetical protein
MRRSFQPFGSGFGVLSRNEGVHDPDDTTKYQELCQKDEEEPNVNLSIRPRDMN